MKIASQNTNKIVNRFLNITNKYMKVDLCVEKRFVNRERNLISQHVITEE